MTEFTVSGSPRGVSQAIEHSANGQNGVTAIVVPWESDGATVRMAVTAVKTDGWAIEHTSLGTISLTDAGRDATRVAVEPHESDHADRQKLAALFDSFAHQIQRTLQTAS